MTSSKYDILLFDAANTLIHKPSLWEKILTVLKSNEINVSEIELKTKHKQLSEIIHFPDQTSADFYSTFNAEVLLALGIIPTQKLLDEIFAACTYLPWVRFDDTKTLASIQVKKAILSNFNNSLQAKIQSIFSDVIFDKIIGSEEEGLGKPDIGFYKRALDILDVKPGRILYIGDSLKLDIIPAMSLGIEAWLIDRENIFTACNKRIKSLSELETLIN